MISHSQCIMPSIPHLNFNASKDYAKYHRKKEIKIRRDLEEINGIFGEKEIAAQRCAQLLIGLYCLIILLFFYSFYLHKDQTLKMDFPYSFRPSIFLSGTIFLPQISFHSSPSNHIQPPLPILPSVLFNHQSALS